MTVQSMPASPGFSFSQFGLQTNSTSFTSPLSRTTQHEENPGAKWFGSFNLPPMPAAQAAPWRTFLVKMRGQTGLVRGYDPDRRTPRGVGPDSVVQVNGVDIDGTVVPSDGWQIGTAGVLLEGDYIQIGTQMFMVVEDVDSDVNGEALIEVEPPIRTPLIDNSEVIVQNPKCLMRLDDDSVVWDGDEQGIISISFNLIEDY